MKRLAGVLCVFLGVILVISGYVAFHYGETSFGLNGVVVTYYGPYIYLAVPLGLLGVVLVAAGMLLLLHHYIVHAELKEGKFADIQICPRCRSAKVKRVRTMEGDMSGHLGWLPIKFECLECGWRERLVLKATDSMRA